MKTFLAVCIALITLCSGMANAQPVPAGQYCPVVSDFDIRGDVIYPGNYITYYQALPPSYTTSRAFSIDEAARVINLTGFAYITGTGIPPNPFPGGLGPVSPGSYRLVVEYYYFPAPNVTEFCPVIDIPFTVGGSGAASATPVPSLGGWMLAALAGLVAGLGLVTKRRFRGR